MQLNASRILLAPLLVIAAAQAQTRTAGIRYVHHGHARQVLDVYVPDRPGVAQLPVFVWIHGGGWRRGDKTDIGLKATALTERGFVFVAVNYRLLPEVEMGDLISDVAKSVRWVHRNISAYGGDPSSLVLGGHSAGAQLAALLCTNDRLLADLGVPFEALRGCVPVDGGTYDVPKMVVVQESRRAIYGEPMPTFGNRQRFDNDPLKHVEFSAVTHIAPDKGIPPFLLLYFTGNPDTRAQARWFERALRKAGVSVDSHGKSDSNHNRLNDELGQPGDPATEALYRFLEATVH